MVRWTLLLPGLLPVRERELRRERAPAPPGVEAPEREMRDETPDLVRWWWRLVGVSSKEVSGTRVVEVSRLESQLWPFSSRVEEARAMPARSIHSASDLGFGVLSGRGRRPCEWEMLGCFLVFGMWWSAWPSSRLCRFVSLKAPVPVELLLRLWRLRELLRECERIGGVLGTETLDR
jgi:hypothetical protein